MKTPLHLKFIGVWDLRLTPYKEMEFVFGTPHHKNRKGRTKSVRFYDLISRTEY